MTGYTNAVILMEELETQSLQMAKLLEEKSELVRIMSHDISNISMAIDISLAKVIKRGVLQEEDMATLTKAKKSSEQLSVILRNVQKLEISQIRGVVLEEVDINEVFKSSAEHFKDQMDAKNISLIIQNDLPLHVKATAEKSSLELGVLSNLLNNAIKFSNEGANITLGAHQTENGAVVITVEDQGRGMSPEDRKNLFVKKLRKSTLGTKGEIGTGLGLGIVNTYVRLYGGEISAHQNYPMGTIFKIALPSTTQFPLGPLRPSSDKSVKTTALN
jgi:signal transduction histidine kinase